MNVANQITHDFNYHPPSRETGGVHEAVRGTLRNACRDIFQAVGMLGTEDRIPTRELSLCKTALEEAMFWANAHIARNMSTNVSETKENTGT